ncbi:carbon-nitrogen hydrolase family protein [Zooshikella ganghwensis]|uniref:Carbon-nitrogen hydrolase family protein n=1 Tax=Zooshikella ganghwensis TaxID=202772 RepID=A0A4P9VK06_9GAMM|nr:carbon-nitrogen hydrolase family protein [Zooshikella ganghwensis]RDH42869.1 carbon-nitrogen hydrolase family protein [Zooshikella ganghwensis]
MKHKVAAVQMNSGMDVAENLTHTERLISQVARLGARLVVLPECFAAFAASDMLAIGQGEQTNEGPIRSFLAEQARTHKIWLVAGSIPYFPEGQTDDRCLASCFVYNDQGEEVARYDKIHLFDVNVDDSKGSYRESKEFLPGKHLVVIDTPFGRVAPVICYDLRFPEIFRKLAEQHVDIFCIPSAFTAVTGAAHWETLVKARAIENFSYVIAANQTGMHGDKRETHGHSMIVDPWGQAIASTTKGEAVILADIDLQKVKQIRDQMPSLSHRCPYELAVIKK